MLSVVVVFVFIVVLSTVVYCVLLWWEGQTPETKISKTKSRTKPPCRTCGGADHLTMIPVLSSPMGTAPRTGDSHSQTFRRLWLLLLASLLPFPAAREKKKESISYYIYKHSFLLLINIRVYNSILLVVVVLYNIYSSTYIVYSIL